LGHVEDPCRFALHRRLLPGFSADDRAASGSGRSM
jgi:hypothetical protein